MTIDTRLKMNSGAEIPQLGFGVWKAKKDDCYKATLKAFEVGYRHIDTAAIYGNEGQVGRALRESGLKREEVFITTKLWNADHGEQKPFDAIAKSLDNLQLDYVDLYLIHFPVKVKRLKSWQALIEIAERGQAKSLGVSNFMVNHLEELLENFEVAPAVNQVEYHPWLTSPELFEFCEDKGILLEAYSPLSHGEKLADAKLAEVASQYGKTPAQILLRWSLQKGNIILPKSVTPSRIAENASLFDFELSEDTMSEISDWNENLRTCWDPTDIP